jgi:MFS family permease
MLLIDVTIVNVALPRMAADLGTSFSSLQWVVDGYALSLGVLLLGAGSLLGALLVQAGSGWPALVPGYAVVGLGVGLVMPVLASSGMAAVPAQRGGMAAGALNTARQLGFAIGVAVLGAVFAGREGALTSRAAAAAGLDRGFLVAAAVGLLAALAVFALVRRAAPAPGRPRSGSVTV